MELDSDNYVPYRNMLDHSTYRWWRRKRGWCAIKAPNLSPRKSRLRASVTGWPWQLEKRVRQSGKALTAVTTRKNLLGRIWIWGCVRRCGWCGGTGKGPRMMDGNNGWKQWYAPLQQNFSWLSRDVKWCAVRKSFATLREGRSTKGMLRRTRWYGCSRTAAGRNFANEIVDPLARKAEEYWRVQINTMRPTMPYAATGTAARRSKETCILLQLSVRCVEQMRSCLRQFELKKKIKMQTLGNVWMT